MRKKRTERIRRQENHLAQILNEPDEWSSQRVKESSEHFGLCLYTQRLRFCFWPKLGRNCADETRISRKVMMGLVELEINQVVVAIDFVTQPGNGRELVIELQNLIQLAKACSVNFQFEHRPSNYEHHTVMQKETRLRGSPS